MITIDKIKQLRKETGVSVIECKKALDEARGDIEKAKTILRKRGQVLAGKKIERTTDEGVIDSYVHPNRKVGVMIDIRCESDFVARSDDFRKLSHEICLQIAAMKPLFLAEESIPEKVLADKRKIYEDRVSNSGKSKDIINKIVEGKLNKYKEEVCLLSQLWIKDKEKTIKDLIDEYIAKLGENIIIKNFVRYEI